MKPDDEVRALRREQAVWSNQRAAYLADIVKLKRESALLNRKLDLALDRERELQIELARVFVTRIVNLDQPTRNPHAYRTVFQCD